MGAMRCVILVTITTRPRGAILYIFTMSEEHHKTPSSSTQGIARMLLSRSAHWTIFSDTWLAYVLIFLAGLLPVFFLPASSATPELAKMLLLESVVFFGLIGWTLGRYRERTISAPKSSLLLLSALLVIQFIIAGLLSPTPLISFIGSGYDIGTVNSFIVLFLLLYLSSLVFGDRDRILTLYASLLGSTGIVLIFHIVRHVMGVDMLNFGIFTSPILSPVGKWNDMASLYGAVTILVLTTLYFFPKNTLIRIPAYVILALCGFFFLLVDFTMLWVMIGMAIMVLCAVAYYDVRKEKDGEPPSLHLRHTLHRIPTIAFVFLFVSIIYASGLAARPVGALPSLSAYLSSTFGATPYSEVMLTPGVTYEVLSETLKESPVYGTGPNRFSHGFLRFKSTEINKTAYWDSEFEFGLGRIPTYVGTTGIMGMILWIGFIVLLFGKVRHVLAIFSKDRIGAYLATSLFLLVLYFWSLALFYLPNITIFALTFLVTGAMIAYFVSEGVMEKVTISLSSSRRKQLILIPIFIFVLIGVFSSGILMYRQVTSMAVYSKAEQLVIAGNYAEGESLIRRAIALSERDTYVRALSNVALFELQRLSGSSISAPELAAKINDLVGLARSSAERAVALDDTNYENHMQLGAVYDVLGSLGVTETFVPARENYLRALALYPKSPRLLYVLGRLELTYGDRTVAKRYLVQALTERPNLPEALSLYVQVEIDDQRPEFARAALLAAVAVEPTNFLLHFALGYMLYAEGIYDEASRSFESAVYLNPVYADAKYFLALSYAQRGLIEQSIAQFEDIRTLNPDNTSIAPILRTLKSGGDIFDTNYVIPAPVFDSAELAQ
jgi:tetratricopeptide (TPR) repeat protein